jgi:hypothetical protein
MRALGRGGPQAPVVHVYPAASGETFDARQNSDGSLTLIGRMMDDKIGAFRKTVPGLVHAAIADPRRR